MSIKTRLSGVAMVIVDGTSIILLNTEDIIRVI
jgi:hypothetical protein